MNLVEADVTDGHVRFGGHSIRLAVGTRLASDARDPRCAACSSRSTRRAWSPRPYVPRRTRAPGDDTLFVDDTRALVTARLDGQRPIAPGKELELAVDLRRLHVFRSGAGRGSRPVIEDVARATARFDNPFRGGGRERTTLAARSRSRP
jgi:hypothetical protein